MLFWDKARNEPRTVFVPVTDLAFDEFARDIYDVEHKAFRYIKSAREVRELVKSKFYTPEKDTQLVADGEIDSKRLKMEDIYMRSTENGVSVWKLKFAKESWHVRSRLNALLFTPVTA